ncbi:MAG TPA: DUF3810 family protein [Saprospiraceae bacterium]|nr:DUF3810 family protein [Saprospiraceae bacterium]
MKKYTGLFSQLTGLIVLMIAILLSRFFPLWMENNYSLVIYPKLNKLLQFFTNWITVPLFCPLLFIVVLNFIKSLKNNKRTLSFTLELSAKYLLFISTSFYLLWGFNYQRIHIKDKLNFKAEVIPDSILANSFKNVITRLDTLSILYHRDNNLQIPDNINELVVGSVHGVLIKLAYPVFHVGKLKAFWPKGFLLRLSTAGFYFPFTGEAYYDKGLHPLQLPFSLCHEYAHAMGFADEGECNFIAYLACHESNELMFRYSADISLYKTIKTFKLDTEVYNFQMLNKTAQDDLISIRKEMEKYPDYIPELRDYIYDLYLKLQGIKEGEGNYNSFVEILIKYNEYLGKDNNKH